MRLGLTVCLVAVVSCGLDPEFECSESSNCEFQGIQGICEETRFCSFPDDGCSGGRRYGSLAGDGLADTCLAAPLECETTAMSVAAGNNITCTLMPDSTVRCRGAGAEGQLGNGTSASVEPVEVLTSLIEPLDSIDQLSAGNQYVCARDTGGQAWCWGNGADGRLGTLPNQIVPNAVQVEESPGVLFAEVVQISARNRHTCAIRDDATPWCWGFGQNGQLGIGSNLNQVVPSQIALPNTQEIRAGSTHTCARDDLGAIFCWGDNAASQLGTGDTVASNVPVPVKRDAATDLVGVTAVAAGTLHTCAATDSGSIFCWGDNTEGQLGDGSTVSRAFAVIAAFGQDPPRTLVAGSRHNCIIRDSDGGVLCWGENSEGQLGAGIESSSESRPVPVISSTDSQPILDVVELSTAGHHTCARTGGGDILCWGRNAAGELGRNPTALGAARRAILVCP